MSAADLPPELVALYRLWQATGNPQFKARCAAEIHRLVAVLVGDEQDTPEERSGTAREAPSTGMRDGTATAPVQTAPEASIGVQPAAPPQKGPLDIPDGVQIERARAPVPDEFARACERLRNLGCRMELGDKPGVFLVDGKRHTRLTIIELAEKRARRSAA